MGFFQRAGVALKAAPRQSNKRSGNITKILLFHRFVMSNVPRTAVWIEAV